MKKEEKFEKKKGRRRRIRGRIRLYKEGKEEKKIREGGREKEKEEGRGREGEKRKFSVEMRELENVELCRGSKPVGLVAYVLRACGLRD